MSLISEKLIGLKTSKFISLTANEILTLENVKNIVIKYNSVIRKFSISENCISCEKNDGTFHIMKNNTEDKIYYIEREESEEKKINDKIILHKGNPFSLVVNIN